MESKMLASTEVLVHFNLNKELILSCDASPYGIGAVLSHRMDDGMERPIVYASRSLAAAEKSQPDKEGLAIIFAVKKFHQFLYGHTFTIQSNYMYKLFQHILGECQPVLALASARLQRWELTLAAYTYRIVCRPGKEISHADGLSQLPLPEAPKEVPQPDGNTPIPSGQCQEDQELDGERLDTLLGPPIPLGRMASWN